jgi:hypothetical protein
MKRCAYCGRENQEAAASCVECGTNEFKPASPEAQAWKRERAKARGRFILCGMLRRGLPFAAPYTVGYFLIACFTNGMASALSELGFLLATFGILVLGVGWFEGARVWDRREREGVRSASGDHRA